MPLSFRDNLTNILGFDNANNLFASTNVAANADGSMIERIEYIQGVVAALTSGQVILNGTVDTAAPSTTNVKCAGLLGYGEDFFNDNWYMQVLRASGAAPEPEVRNITNYVTATGTFTVDAFSVAVASGDFILLLHESQVVIGRNDANNTFDSSTVVANADGSILERLEYIQGLSDTEIADIKTETDKIADIKTETDKIAAEIIKTAAIQTDIGDPSARTNFKSLEAMLGLVDDTNSSLDDILRTGFDSSTIGNDEDGSIMERLEGLKDRLTTIAGYLTTEIADILLDTGTTLPAQITALENVSTTEVNTEVDSALNTIVPASPTAGSLNDFLSKAAGGNNFDKATDSLEAIADKVADVSDVVVGVTANTAAVKREAGRRQVLTVPINGAANDGSVTLGTITTQACTIEKVILTADGITTSDLTSAAIEGGAAGAIEFISAATAVTASINAADEQVSYDGQAVIPATGTITVDLQGTGATVVALKAIIVFYANVDGGYIAV